jgi:hypothetical protein
MGLLRKSLLLKKNRRLLRKMISISTKVTVFSKILFIFLMSLASPSCVSIEDETSETASQVPSETYEWKQPVIRAELIRIPSKGKASEVKGEIMITKRKENLSRRIIANDVIEFKDLLDMKKGSYVKIIFDVGGGLEIGPVNKNVWVSFEKM